MLLIPQDTIASIKYKWKKKENAATWTQAISQGDNTIAVWDQRAGD